MSTALAIVAIALVITLAIIAFMKHSKTVGDRREADVKRFLNLPDSAVLEYGRDIKQEKQRELSRDDSAD